MKISGFTFSRIVLIQSLEPHEIQTGLHLSQHIDAQISASNHQIQLEYITCSSSFEFIEILRRLTRDAKAKGEFPIIHVECHGSSTEGLEFENGSTLSWDALALELLQLNVACKFNLLAVFSACFGGHFLSQLDVISPAPCWCMIAPTETVDPAEIMHGFRIFYTTLLSSSDAGKAAAAISKARLSYGHWFSQPAEIWFEKVVTNYITKHCTKEATRDRAKKLHRQIIKEGHPYKSIGHITRELCRLNRTNLLGKYFDTYFQTTVIPENIQRFQHARDRLELKLNDLRCSKKYSL
jgi:hypothetical protein